MFENPRRGRQASNFTTNAPKILDLKSSSEQIFSRKLPLGAPDKNNSQTFGKQSLFAFEKLVVANIIPGLNSNAWVLGKWYFLLKI